MVRFTKAHPNQIIILNHALLHWNEGASVQIETGQKHYNWADGKWVR